MYFLNSHLPLDIAMLSLVGEYFDEIWSQETLWKMINAAVLGYIPFPEHQEDFNAH